MTTVVLNRFIMVTPENLRDFN